MRGTEFLNESKISAFNGSWFMLDLNPAVKNLIFAKEDVMKRLLEDPVFKENDEPENKPAYETPQINGATGKTSMSGAGCPTHTVQWQQVSCKC